MILTMMKAVIRGSMIMYKTTEMNFDRTVKSLLESELGFLLLQSDSTTDMYSLLSEQSTFEDRLGMFGYDTHITYHLFPIMYHKSVETDINYTKPRSNAIYNVFKRWTSMGYNKHHAKDPFNSRAFIKYLDELEWNTADYMLLIVE